MTGKVAQPQNDKATSGPRLWVVLARAYGALASYVEARIANEGLCLSDFMVLEVLLHKGPMTMSAICDKVLLANASMTSAVDRLDKLGYVVRKNTSDDRRIRIIELTAGGHSFITALYERHARDIEAVMSELDQAERAQLRSLLKKIGTYANSALDRNPTKKTHYTATDAAEQDSKAGSRKGKRQ